MPIFEPNQFHGEPWTPAQIRRLKKLLTQDTALAIVALRLGRTPTAIKKKAVELAAEVRRSRAPDLRPRRGR